MKQTLAFLLGFALLLLSSCSQMQTESRALTANEIEMVNQAFEPLLPARQGDPISETGPDVDWI